jgi:hypothetical protein
VAELTHLQYDLLERSIARGSRISVRRRGAELVVTPLALKVRGRREVIESRHPTTGDFLVLFLDELDGIEALP